jgi:hypothetical protein
MRAPQPWSVVMVILAVAAAAAGCDVSSDADGPQDVRAPEVRPSADVEGPSDARVDAPEPAEPDAAAPLADPALLPVDADLLAWTPPALDEERRRACSECATGRGNDAVRVVRVTRTVAHAEDEPLLARAEALRTARDAAPCDLRAPAVSDDDGAFPERGDCVGRSARFLLWRRLRSLAVDPATGAWPADALPSCLGTHGEDACRGRDFQTTVAYEAHIERRPGAHPAGDGLDARALVAGDPDEVVADARVARVVLRSYNTRTASHGDELSWTFVFDPGGRLVLAGVTVLIRQPNVY